jgi:hypothetical protein
MNTADERRSGQLAQTELWANLEAALVELDRLQAILRETRRLALCDKDVVFPAEEALLLIAQKISDAIGEQ